MKPKKKLQKHVHALAKSALMEVVKIALAKIVHAKDVLVANLISKNSKVKKGLTPGYTPKFHPEPSEDASIPFVQRDGKARYLSSKDYQWMIDNNFIEVAKTTSQDQTQ